MTKLLTVITLFFLSIGIYAQEKQVWACQMEASTMLYWENNKWQQLRINPYNILFTIDAGGITGSAKDSTDGFISDLSCSFQIRLNRYSCLSSTLAVHYLFNPDTEKLGFSNLHGAVSNSAGRDSVTAATFNCTKF